MARPKGQPKLGGRQKGTENKITRELKPIIKEIIDGQIDNVPEWFRKAAMKDPAKAVQLLIQLLEFIVPKAKTEIDVTTNGESLRQQIADNFNKMFPPVEK